MLPNDDISTEYIKSSQGAGEANLGIAGLLAMAMEKREGVPLEDAKKKIFMRDSRGLIVKGRSSGELPRKLYCARTSVPGGQDS